LQWLQNPSQIQVNGDNLNNIRCVTTTAFRNKKKKVIITERINDLETDSKNKRIRDLYRWINKFKKGYQPRTN